MARAGSSRIKIDPRNIGSLLSELAKSPIPVASYELTAEGPKFTFFPPAVAQSVFSPFGSTEQVRLGGQGEPSEDGWQLVTNPEHISVPVDLESPMADDGEAE